MAANDGHFGESFGQHDEIVRCRFTGVIAVGFEPGVLEDHGLQFGGAADDRINSGHAAFFRHPQLHTHHRAIGHAALQFGETFLGVLGAKIDEAKCSIWELCNGAQHFVVLLHQISGGGILRPLQAHVNAQSLDAHAVGINEECLEAFLRREAGNAGHVAMQIPNTHGVN